MAVRRDPITDGPAMRTTSPAGGPAIGSTWRNIQGTDKDRKFWEDVTAQQLGTGGGANFWGTLKPGQAVSGSPGYEWAQQNGMWGTQKIEMPKPGETPDMTFMPTAAPTFTAPTRTGAGAQPVLGVVDPYTGPGTFVAPTADTMTIDPGYQFRVNEGQRLLDATAAARGTLRGSNHLQNMQRFGQDYASQEYGNIFGRAKDIYGLNKTAADDAYDRSRLERDTRYAAATGDWNRDFTERGAAYNAAFEGAEAAYKPQYDTWTAQQLAGANNALLNFNRGYDRENRYWDDKYNRETRDADNAWREKVYTGDDAWRRYLSDIQQRQFLATLGNQ